ncbi:MotA/TolQ/ExbB proton channel family protein [uncultured Gimesia sp.]|uniref:MotA/TolQ/ExbB proton channel family protein n=1 Tax=uncultured Gimesia sp. TaxID=1678688 RepID=UPI0026071CEB|nr:MotA/TolQ/ExbB proton channel family protein [uncultured Gimesia sp.]
MYFQFPCEKCSKKLKVRDENIGKKVRCPYCQHTMLVKKPETPVIDTSVDFSASSTATHSTKTSSSRTGSKTVSSGWADGTEVSLSKSGMIAIGASVVFIVLMFPFRKYYLGELFLDRGWVPFALVFLMSWSATILILKSRKLAKQKDSMLFDTLPTDISEEISEKTVAKFIEHVKNLPVDPRESFLVNRVLRGLEHFSVLKSSAEVSNRLQSQSEIDATSIDSSYTMLKVFIWAIPILGFIGTVIGIGTAVGGFSGGMDKAADISALKASLGNVTGGLSTAFDTTLVALVMSMLVMFPSSSMQKSEEDLLNWVDEYCNENLLKRLKESDHVSSGDERDHRRLIQRTIDKAMADHHAELQTWTQKLEGIGSTLSQQVMKSWGKIDDKIRAQQEEQLEKVQQVIDKLTTEHHSVVEQMENVEQKMSELQTAHAENLDKLNGDAAEMAQAADTLSQSFSGVQQGLNGLNTVLSDLGEKQVLIQQVEAPRKRWGFFGGSRKVR